MGGIDRALELFAQEALDAAVIAVGTSVAARVRLREICEQAGLPLANVIDPTVRICGDVRLGTGNIICAHCQFGVAGRHGPPRPMTGSRHTRPALRRSNLGNKVRPIALTFDDGPNPQWTPRVCGALAVQGITATFFIWGEQAERHPEVVLEVLKRGHRVQPHCWAHTSHLEMTPKQIAADIDRVLTFLAEIGAPAPQLWRPPWGHLHAGATESIAAKRGLELAGWTINTTDYDGTSAADMHTMIVDRIARVAAENPVILMHDNYLEPGQKRSDAAETVELIGLLAGDEDRSFAPLAHGLRPGLDEQRKRSAMWLRRVRRRAV